MTVPLLEHRSKKGITAKVPHKKLTVIAIKSLPPGNYADAGYPGLNLRIGVHRRTWSVYHRVGGRQRQTRLGFFPAMGLAEARRAAAELVERVDAGGAPLPPKPHPRAALTLEQLVDRYEVHRRRKAGRGIKTLAQSMRTIRSGLEGYLTLPATAFTKADLRAARDTIAGRGALTQANRFQAYLSPILRWAEAEDLIERDFSRAVIRVGAEVKRTRVLTADEIRRIWRACDRLDRPDAGGHLVRFLILTGQRRGEVAGMKHGHVLDGLWRQTENKADREHRLRLPGPAIEQLGTGSADEFCFPGFNGHGPYRSFIWLKRRLDELSGVGSWRLHDLRRTFASGLQDLGVNFLVIEALLNHQIAGVASHYLHGELAVAKAEALGRWAAEVERIVGVRQAVL